MDTLAGTALMGYLLIVTGAAPGVIDAPPTYGLIFETRDACMKAVEDAAPSALKPGQQFSCLSLFPTTEKWKADADKSVSATPHWADGRDWCVRHIDCKHIHDGRGLGATVTLEFNDGPKEHFTLKPHGDAEVEGDFGPEIIDRQ